MLRLILFLLLAAPCVGAAPLPQVNMVLEFRWVETALTSAAQAGVRDGAVVLGTGGSVSPRGAAVLSTQTARVGSVQRLSVLNGSSARVQLQRNEPIQWLDVVAEVEPGSRRAPRVWAAPRSSEGPGARKKDEVWQVAPSWPGGVAPAKLSFQVQAAAGDLESTVSVPLDVWTAVAFVDVAGDHSASPGRLSSSDGKPAQSLKLQVRISKAVEADSSLRLPRRD